MLVIFRPINLPVSRYSVISSIFRFVRPYSYAFVRSCDHQCFRLLVRVFVRSYVCAGVRAFVRSCVRAFVHPEVSTLVGSCFRAFVFLTFMFSFVRSFFRLIISVIFCLLVHRKKKNPINIGKRLCIAPDITILCRVQKHTVPFHMFLPVRLGLYPLFHQIAVKCSTNFNFAIFLPSHPSLR